MPKADRRASRTPDSMHKMPASHKHMTPKEHAKAMKAMKKK